MEEFVGKRVIVTIKMDGENTTMYCDEIHARSIDGRNHDSRNWVKQFWSQISYNIPKDWRICGENLYAEHSISYDNLESYFMGFSVWDNKNVCLDWDSTLEWFSLLGIFPVQVIYDGIYDEEKIKNLWNPNNSDKCEGYVLRVADSFSYGEFRKKVAKFVREGHIRTNKHWMFGQPIFKNGLNDAYHQYQILNN
jgi:hypothetical protein